MIDVKDLSKSFGNLHVLNGINEHIYKGEKVVIIGPSGSGKSTFLRCLNLMEKPTSGSICVEGEYITDRKANVNLIRRKMGMVFQHFGHTAEFKFYEVENGQVTASEVVSTNGQGHGALVGFLVRNGVNVLLCGGIGGGAQMALAQAGIRLCGGITGDADSAAAAYLAGTLVFDPNARCTHHDHEESHSCGSHACHADKGGCTGSCH